MSEQDNGTIMINSTHQVFEYNTDQFNKDDTFIDIGMKTQADLDGVTNASPGYGVIGATIFNYDVQVPGLRTTVPGWPFGANFKRKKGD